MAQSKLEVCNTAISLVGGASAIANFELDNSREGLACRRWYTIVARSVQQQQDWVACFATAVLSRSLPSLQTRPSSTPDDSSREEKVDDGDLSPYPLVVTEGGEIATAVTGYLLPDNFLRVHELWVELSSTENSHKDRVILPYTTRYQLPETSGNPRVPVIYTNYYDDTSATSPKNNAYARVVLAYFRYAEDEALWTPIQYEATIYSLAARLARPLTNDQNLVVEMTTLAREKLQMAEPIEVSSNYSFTEARLPPTIRARGASAPQQGG